MAPPTQNGRTPRSGQFPPRPSTVSGRQKHRKRRAPVRIYRIGSSVSDEAETATRTYGLVPLVSVLDLVLRRICESRSPRASPAITAHNITPSSTRLSRIARSLASAADRRADRDVEAFTAEPLDDARRIVRVVVQTDDRRPRPTERGDSSGSVERREDTLHWRE